jgi:ribosomal protein L32
MPATQEQECPICGDRFEANTVDPATVPAALADILGTTPLGAAEGWNHNQRAKLEQLLDRHLRAHRPDEWLPKLMTVRRQLEALLESGANAYNMGAHTTAQLIARECRAEAERIDSPASQCSSCGEPRSHHGKHNDQCLFAGSPLAAGLRRAAEIADTLAGEATP